MEDHGIHPLPLDDFATTFTKLSGAASNLGMSLFSCCIKHFIPGWTGDSGCLSPKGSLVLGKDVLERHGTVFLSSPAPAALVATARSIMISAM
jgi:hypothetical protein